MRDTAGFGNFSPDGKTIVGTCGEHLLCLWKLPAGAGAQPGAGQPATNVPSARPSATPTSVPEQPATPTEQAKETTSALEPLSESNIARVGELNRIFSPHGAQTLAFVPGVQTTTLAIGSGSFE